MKLLTDKLYKFLLIKKYHFLIGAFLFSIFGYWICEWRYDAYYDLWASFYPIKNQDSPAFYNPYSAPWHNLRWKLFHCERLFISCFAWLILHESIFKKVAFIYFVASLNVFLDRICFNEHEFGLNDWFAYGCIVLYLINSLKYYAVIRRNN